MAGSPYPFGNMNRRSLLKGAVAAGLWVADAPAISTSFAQAPFKSNPFTLGVASGDPAPDGFVIWTRLAPEPMLARGGMLVPPVEVAYEIADDPGMKQVLQKGTAIARIELAHSVHVEVAGLVPGRDYFYRFRAGEVDSPIGRARTFPAAGAPVSAM